MERLQLGNQVGRITLLVIMPPQHSFLIGSLLGDLKNKLSPHVLGLDQLECLLCVLEGNDVLDLHRGRPSSIIRATCARRLPSARTMYSLFIVHLSGRWKATL